MPFSRVEDCPISTGDAFCLGRNFASLSLKSFCLPFRNHIGNRKCPIQSFLFTLAFIVKEVRSTPKQWTKPHFQRALNMLALFFTDGFIQLCVSRSRMPLYGGSTDQELASPGRCPGLLCAQSWCQSILKTLSHGIVFHMPSRPDNASKTGIGYTIHAVSYVLDKFRVFFPSLSLQKRNLFGKCVVAFDNIVKVRIGFSSAILDVAMNAHAVLDMLEPWNCPIAGGEYVEVKAIAGTKSVQVRQIFPAVSNDNF